jgi:hypothetical protein
MIAALLSSCGGGANSTSSGQNASGVSVAVSPSATSISAGGSQTFVASVAGTSNTNVTWNASAGVISGTGNTVNYTAPAAAGSYTVSATSAADTSKSASATITAVTGGTSACSGFAVGQEASLNGFRPFPDTNPWNQDISTAQVDSNSATIIGFIGGAGLHADFGSGTFAGAPIGIPYIVVDSTQANVAVNVGAFANQSDIVPSPIPVTAPIEATATTVWDLQTYNNRPYTWTSADAAGLPIFPGLIRFDEIVNGAINHAIRFTVPGTKAAFVSPATHWAGTDSTSPIPMGMRLRLKSGFNVSTFSTTNQIILNAMKKYGLLLADNGSPMFISGMPDSRWDNNDLHLLGGVTASDFEAVQLPTVITSGNVPTGTAPTIGSFTSSAPHVAAGTAITLTWQATGASYYLVTPQAGPVRGNSVVVNPAATTTYTLSATNAFGRTKATVTVQVP